MAIPSIPYRNLRVDEGFNYAFEIDVTDGVTGAPLDLTGCTVSMTVCNTDLLAAVFVLSTTDGSIQAPDSTGILSIVIPGSASVGLSGTHLLYDVVVTDQISVSISVLRGVMTVDQVA